MINKEEIYKIVLKHLPGKHDQKRHGNRGRGFSGTIEYGETPGGATADSRGNKIIVNKDKFNKLSKDEKHSVIVHEIAHSTVDDWIDRNAVSEYPKAANALLLKKRVDENGIERYLYIGGNTKLTEAIADTIGNFISRGDSATFNDMFGRPIKDDKWKAWAMDVIRRSGYSASIINRQADKYLASLEKIK